MLTCNVAFVDLITEKLFYFNKQSVREITFGLNGKKQLKNIEKIIENKIQKVYEGVRFLKYCLILIRDPYLTVNMTNIL